MSTVEKPTFERIVFEHGQFIRRTLSQLGVCARDQADVEQEVFRGISRGLPAFDPALSVNPDKALRSWLFGICERQAASHRRMELRRGEVFVTNEELDVTQCGAPDVEERLVDAERRAILQELLETLDPHRKAVVVAYELEGIAMCDVAAALSIPVNTAWNRLRLAREDLRVAWKRIAHQRKKRNSLAPPPPAFLLPSGQVDPALPSWLEGPVPLRERLSSWLRRAETGLREVVHRAVRPLAEQASSLLATVPSHVALTAAAGVLAGNLVFHPPTWPAVPATPTSTAALPSSAEVADTRGANGGGANEQAADGQTADGQTANEQAANEHSASRQGANGEGANAEGANGQGANAKGANGQGANAEGANGQGADAQAAGARNASLQAAGSRDDESKSASLQRAQAPSGGAARGSASNPGVAGTDKALRAESAQLAAADRALVQGDLTEARRRLEEAARSTPHSQLAPTRLVLDLRLLLQEGRRNEARERARRFLAANPQSPSRASIEAAVGKVD